VNHGGDGGDVRAVLNLPLGDKVAFRISGFDQDVPGYIDDPLQNKSSINDGHKNGEGLPFWPRPRMALTVRLTATTQDSKYNERIRSTPTGDIEIRARRPHAGAVSRRAPAVSSTRTYNATIDWNTGPVTSYRPRVTASSNSDTVSDATFCDPRSAVHHSRRNSRRELRRFLSAAMRTTRGLEEVHPGNPPVVAGFRYARMAGRRISIPAKPASSSAPERRELPSGASAGLPRSRSSSWIPPIRNGQGSPMRPTTSIRSSTSRRADDGPPMNRTSRKVSRDFSSQPTVRQPSKGNVFTYSVAPRWHIDANNMLYARVATGYRPGVPKRTMPPIAPPDVPGNTARTRRPTSNWASGRPSSTDCCPSMSPLSRRLEDIQLFEVVDNTGINGNGGKARSQGLEWTVAYVPAHGLTLTSTAPYTDRQT